jgi:hypothetical protein
MNMKLASVHENRFKKNRKNGSRRENVLLNLYNILLLGMLTINILEYLTNQVIFLYLKQSVV